MAVLDLARMKAPPSADRSRPWAAGDQRAWDLKQAYEAAARRYQPGFSLRGFLATKNSRKKDPRDVHVFKSTFRHLDDRAGKVGASAEELITAFTEHFGARSRVSRKGEPFSRQDIFHKPNAMLNPKLAEFVLDKFWGHLAGKASSDKEAGVRQRAEVVRATASLRERARESVFRGWTGLAIYLAKGRLLERHEPWWEEIEPWMEGETVLGPYDQYRDNLLACVSRIPMRRREHRGQLALAVRLTLEGKKHLIPEDYEPDVHDEIVQVAPARRTAVVRRRRRRWGDLVWGWLAANGAHQSREFLWGVGPVVPMPEAVAGEARAAYGVAESVAGPDADAERLWGASTLREWHRDAWAAVLDPVLLRLAAMERSGNVWRDDGGFAEAWAGPQDPTPLSRAYSAEEGARVAATAPGYLP